jgi:predicted transcriptional regulator
VTNYNDEHIRRQLKQLLKDTTQMKLSKKLGISQTKLSQYIDGTRPHASDKMLSRLGYKRCYKKMENV